MEENLWQNVLVVIRRGGGGSYRSLLVTVHNGTLRYVTVRLTGPFFQWNTEAKRNCY